MVDPATIEGLRKEHLKRAPGDLRGVDVRPVAGRIVDPLVDHIQGNIRVRFGELVLLREANRGVPSQRTYTQSINN